jgi:YVTN family beta-propeller protein
VGPVSIINTTNNTAYASTNVGNYPWGVAVTPDGTKAYVANSVDNTISVIDTTNNTFYSSVNVENVPAAF